MAEKTDYNWFNQSGITDYSASPIVAVAADALVIPITHPLVNKTTGGDAEALILANGIFKGQILKVYLGTAGGGVGTITPVTATGWATFVLTAANDQGTFQWIDDTIGWIIIGTAGAANTPTIT